MIFACIGCFILGGLTCFGILFTCAVVSIKRKQKMLPKNLKDKLKELRPYVK